MSILASLLILSICGYILHGEYRKYRINRTKEMYARRLRMDAERERQRARADLDTCRKIESLPLSEVDD